MPWIKFGARKIYIWIKAHLMNCINEFRTITCFYCNWYANIIIMTISCPWISKGSHAITIKRTIISSHLTTNYLHQDLVPKSKTKFDNNRASIVAISYIEFAICYHKTVVTRIIMRIAWISSYQNIWTQINFTRKTNHTLIDAWMVCFKRANFSYLLSIPIKNFI